MNYTILDELAASLGCQVTPDAPMATATTFRVGGPADRLIDIPTAQAAGVLLSLCRKEGIPCLWLGNGSNLLVGDKGIRGAVLRLEGRRADPVLEEDNTLYAPAGISLSRLAVFARDNSLTGLEFAHGIPGTLGGAVYMNAGAYGGEIAGVLIEIEALTPDGEPVVRQAAELTMGYRHTSLMDEGLIVTAARLHLAPGDREAIAATMKDLMTRRQEKQPLEFPSAGSFFKRPVGHFAGALIEQAGLKGYQVGGARVSEKHAGFVVNTGDATAAHIRQLCRDVQAEVRRQFGVELEPEVRFVGEF